MPKRAKLGYAGAFVVATSCLLAFSYALFDLLLGVDLELSGAFVQTLIVESGSDNTYMESISEVKARLVGNIALVASYTIKRNSSVPVGSEKRDTFTAISLEYAF